MSADAILFSAGTQPPRHPAPPGACDCHFHIYDGRVPTAAGAGLAPPDAGVSDYLRLREHLGLTRGVVVTPSIYGTNNAATLTAVAALGDSVRGIAVVDSSVTDAELRRLDARGIRGIRFNLVRPGATSIEMFAPLAHRIADLGWHIQVHMTADAIADNAALFAELPVPIVFDHFGRVPQPGRLDHPGFALICRLLGTGKAFVKISGPYQDSRIGPPSYPDVAPLAKAYIAVAPERVLWASDWPHPTQGAFGLPNDAHLFDLARAWAGSTEVWQRILVSNPEALYRFSKTAGQQRN